jgi:cell division protein FtsI/penicillin-binding protein 2
MSSNHQRVSITHLTAFFLVAFSILALTLGYWTFITRDSLLSRNDNPRALIAFNRIQRGSILDRNGVTLAESLGVPGDYVRHTDPASALVIGYSSFTYGLSGIEAAADSVLSGLNESDPTTRWWHYDVLDEPQLGHAITLTLDRDLQRSAYTALEGHPGTAVILDSTSGEILAMASSPSFDPAQLETQFDSFTADSNGPLINRATLGLYRANDLINLFPRTLDLSQTPVLPIPVRPVEEKRITPVHLAYLIAAVANAGVRPIPHLILKPDSLTSVGHTVAIISPSDAADLYPLFASAYNATTASGFEDETLGWYVAIESETQRIVVIVLENSNANEAAALASQLRR